MAFRINSSSFRDMGLLPPHYTCEGANVSPELHWDQAPANTRSYALVMEEPDVRHRRFVHWMLFDIPPSVRRLAEGQKNTGLVARNDFQFSGYGGPCPPPRHGKHRFVFRLFALDAESLELPEGAPCAQVLDAIELHKLDETSTMAIYERR